MSNIIAITLDVPPSTINIVYGDPIIEDDQPTEDDTENQGTEDQ